MNIFTPDDASRYDTGRWQDIGRWLAVVAACVLVGCVLLWILAGLTSPTPWIKEPAYITQPR